MLCYVVFVTAGRLGGHFMGLPNSLFIFQQQWRVHLISNSLSWLLIGLGWSRDLELASDWSGVITWRQHINNLSLLYSSSWRGSETDAVIWTFMAQCCRILMGEWTSANSFYRDLLNGVSVMLLMKSQESRMSFQLDEFYPFYSIEPLADAWINHPNSSLLMTNQRPVSRSCDHSRPIRGQYPGHVITLDQSDSIPPPSTRMPTRTSGSTQSGLIIPWRGFLSRISQSLIHQPMTVCSTQIGVRDKCILMQSGVRDKCILTQSVVRDACILTQSRVRDKCILTPEWSERQMYIDADAEWSERRMYIDAG